MDSTQHQKLQSLMETFNHLAYQYKAAQHAFYGTKYDYGIAAFLKNEERERWAWANKVADFLQTQDCAVEFKMIPASPDFKANVLTLQALQSADQNVHSVLKSYVDDVSNADIKVKAFYSFLLYESEKEAYEVSAVVAEVLASSSSAFKMMVLNDELRKKYSL